MTTFLIDVPTEITPEQRRHLKRVIGMLCRAVLADDPDADLPITVDHLGLPVDATQLDDTAA